MIESLSVSSLHLNPLPPSYPAESSIPARTARLAADTVPQNTSKAAPTQRRTLPFGSRTRQAAAVNSIALDNFWNALFLAKALSMVPATFSNVQAAIAYFGSNFLFSSMLARIPS